MSTIHNIRGEHSTFWNHVNYVDNEIMEADISTSMTKRMRTEQMRYVSETEDDYGGAGRRHEIICCRGRITG
eukprot:8141481-Heterocapsa_arctica.AAC.1